MIFTLEEIMCNMLIRVYLEKKDQDLSLLLEFTVPKNEK